MTNAIVQLSEQERKSIVVRVVGRKDNQFTEIQNKLENLPCVHLTGDISREDMDVIYQNSDVLVCCSRMECLPTTVIEAMTHRIPSIVSTAAGITRNMKDGETAIFFQSENENALAEKIRWCLNNRHEAKSIGEKSYKVYEQMYSMEVFSGNILREVKSILSRYA